MYVVSSHDVFKILEREEVDWWGGKGDSGKLLERAKGPAHSAGRAPLPNNM